MSANVASTKYELSKTYQYRKVMKPLLERKRRARINKCLDDLKDLMADCLQQQIDDSNSKFEKTDILELTVQHLRKLKQQRQQQRQSQASNTQQQQHCIGTQQSFRSGYIQAANEISRCLATLPNVNVALGTKLMTHLGQRLNQLESNDATASRTAINAPLSINCPGSSASSTTSALYSPVSSGYASDNDCSRSSPALSASSKASTSSSSCSSQGLLQLAAPVWRPW